MGLYGLYNDDLVKFKEYIEDGSYLSSDSWDCYCEGELEVPLNVKIDGFGQIVLPATQDQLTKLVKKIHNSYSLEGQGDTDLNEHRVWNIPSSLVKFEGSTWNSTMSKILKECREGLGIDNDQKIKASLNKLLMFGEGGPSLFETEEEDSSIFGTLVIVLPCEHSGGELRIKHGLNSVSIDLENSTPSIIKYSAFYNDCKHKVKHIATGYRLCLVYNLIKSGKRTLSATSLDKKIQQHDQDLEDFGEILSDELDVNKMLVYILNNKYKSQISFSNLHGTDQIVGKKLLALKEIYGLSLYSAQLIIEEAVLDINDDGASNDYTLYLRDFIDSDGNEWPISTLKVDEQMNIIPSDYLEEDLKPYSVKKTGRNTKNRSYKTSVIVVFKEVKTISILSNYGCKEDLKNELYVKLESNIKKLVNNNKNNKNFKLDSKEGCQIIVDHFKDSYFKPSLQLPSSFQSIINKYFPSQVEYLKRESIRRFILHPNKFIENLTSIDKYFTRDEILNVVNSNQFIKNKSSSGLDSVSIFRTLNLCTYFNTCYHRRIVDSQLIQSFIDKHSRNIVPSDYTDNDTSFINFKSILPNILKHYPEFGPKHVFKSIGKLIDKLNGVNEDNVNGIVKLLDMFGDQSVELKSKLIKLRLQIIQTKINGMLNSNGSKTTDDDLIKQWEVIVMDKDLDTKEVQESYFNQLILNLNIPIQSICLFISKSFTSKQTSYQLNIQALSVFYEKITSRYINQLSNFIRPNDYSIKVQFIKQIYDSTKTNSIFNNNKVQQFINNNNKYINNNNNHNSNKPKEVIVID